MPSRLSVPEGDALRRGEAEVGIRAFGRDPRTLRPLQIALLEQVGLVDVLDGLGFLAHRRGERLESDGTAAELLGDGAEEAAVLVVESLVVDLERSEGLARHGKRDDAVVPDLSVVADALQPAVGDARGPARPARDLERGGGLDLDLHDPGGAPHEALERVGRQEVEAIPRAEAVA